VLEQDDGVFRGVIEETLSGHHPGLVAEVQLSVRRATAESEHNGVKLGVLLNKLEKIFAF
jgi:hypothetical protein